MPKQAPISHAFVLPDRDFDEWLVVLGPYLKAFPRVAVVRSPAGNNLNRFRNVSAVQAPLTWWKDSALAHIRRVYPSVVMVDVVDAASPVELRPILQRRIQQKDRYGQRDAMPQHIFQRFVLEWPTSARPIRVLARFNDDEEAGALRPSLDVASQAGAAALCGAAGRVLSTGEEIQIESLVEGRRYLTSYSGLQQARVRIGETVKAGQQLGSAKGDRLRLTVQSPPAGGISIGGLHNLLNPREYLYIDGFRLRPTVDNLNLRALPSLYASIVGRAYSWQLLEPREHHGRALEKIGEDGSWLKLRSAGGVEGYAAAWYLSATTQHEGTEVFPGINPAGVNLDIFHPRGKPHPAKLGGLGWVRFGYNVSSRRGSEDIRAALQRYLPYFERYRAAGYRIVVTTSHQTYGEGKNEYWPWEQMTDAKWRRLIARFADMMSDIAAQWAGRDLISAWQVWNEPDSLSGVASVPLRARNYGLMFREVKRAIRSADSNVQIITAGFNSGPGRGSAYARAMLRELSDDDKPDGLAFHPYGRGVNGHPYYAMFGHIDESIWAYSNVMPDKPLWITEWGVLDRGNDKPADIARYALGFLRYLQRQYPGRIAVMIWYAWAQGMHNGYGLIDQHGRSRPPLTQEFLSF
ncbi:MAG: cellulase family glycosylhydrolase [Chloroflexota bacterium]|nr:cellulase family glycosylhydrolase [Chloroflexota bacterium]MCY3581949.1 cellulase family glycosylhydrolase [Chloroflexota bacterium]MDE2650914.1 cellulase family glycosylhydrolase [Chloroflexota bacterium]